MDDDELFNAYVSKYTLEDAKSGFLDEKWFTLPILLKTRFIAHISNVLF